MRWIARASVCLIALVTCAGCFWADGDEWEQVTVGGPEGCWKVSYSSYRVVDEEAFRSVRPYEQCPFDFPSRNDDDRACDEFSGTTMLPIVFAEGRPQVDEGEPGLSVMAALSIGQLATPLDQAECVLGNGGMHAYNDDLEQATIHGSDPFELEIAGREAVCIETTVPSTDGSGRVCWFQVGAYTVRVQGGNYPFHRELIDEFFEDVARSVYLDPGRACEPMCDD